MKQEEEIERSTRKIFAALEKYDADERGGDEEITDLLVDIRHYCDLQGIGFDSCNAMAEIHYQEEQPPTKEAPQ